MPKASIVVLAGVLAVGCSLRNVSLCEEDPTRLGCFDAGPDGPIGCSRNRDCPAWRPVCAGNLCTACTTTGDCERLGDEYQCAPSGACVVCLDASECGDEEACVAGECAADCMRDEDCAGRAGRGRCDAGTGDCVACRPATEATDCTNAACTTTGSTSCHPTTGACTATCLGSLGVCRACLGDAECADGARCVETTFGTAPNGTHCLIDLATLPTPDAGVAACPNRFPAARLATSLGGAEATYCFPNTGINSCEGILSFQNLCPGGDADCGTPSLADGLCITGRCTYSCAGESDCLDLNGDMDCIGTLPTYCDPN